MKTIGAVVFLLLVCELVIGQTQKTEQRFAVTASVDERVELTSIVARLADYEEYVNDQFKNYAADVDRHFAKYKHHPAVEFARSVRESDGVSFNAIASFAVHLKPDLTPKIAFTDNFPDPRLGKENSEKFARLLKAFYKDAECSAFFSSHGEMYKLAAARMQKIVDKVDFSWYRKFYGEDPKGSLDLWVALLNGQMNFGQKVIFPNGREEMFALIGTSNVDEKGIPVFTDSVLPTIIHEFNHSFINHLIDGHEKELKVSGEKIFGPVAEKMARIAYGDWKTVLLESVVRAAVIRYLTEHGETEKAARRLTEERNNGFLWVDELTVLLGTYSNSRLLYPTFRAFIPLLEGYFTDLSGRIESKVKNFEALLPRVISIDAFANGAQDVDPKLSQITFTFDRALVGNAQSISYSNSDQYPIEKMIGYNSDRTKFTVQLALKPDREYDFTLTGVAFLSPDGYPLQTYQVKFRTRK